MADPFETSARNIGAATRADFWNGGGSYEGKLGPWSTLVIDGLVFPGVESADDPGACPVEITGDVKYAIDRQKVRGRDGHKLVSERYEPTKILVTAKIYTAAQWSAFKAYLSEINPKLKTNFRKAFSVAHPFFAAYGLTQMYINEVGLPKEGDGRMVRIVTMNLWEVFDIDPVKPSATKVIKQDAIPGVVTQGQITGDQPPGTVAQEPNHP